VLESLIQFIATHNAINDKTKLAALVKEKFALTKDRAVFYNSEFAIRFSKANSTNFSNTVLGLSALQKYDDRLFIVCLVLPKENILLLANSTFLKKISHTSQALRVDNIRGSFNGSDIFRAFNDIANAPENFEELFAIHQALTFEENLVRLVEATNQIAPTGWKFAISKANRISILNAPSRAKKFSESGSSNS